MEGQESQSQSVETTPAAPVQQESVPASQASASIPTLEKPVSTPESIADKLAKRAEARKRAPDGKFKSQSGENPDFIPPEVKAKQTPEIETPATPEAPADPSKPKWEPNFKFKFAAEGKPKQEGEIHDFLREAVKSPEHEKVVRELYEKAHGLDFIKPQFTRTREELQKANQTLQGVMAGIQDMGRDYHEAVKPGGNIFRLDDVFRRLKIPEEVVLQWGAAKAEYYQLPPEQRSVLDARQAAEHRALNAERQLATAQSSSMEQTRQAKAYALQSSLTRPDVSPIASAYDDRVGKPGSFAELVAEFGDYQWHRSNGTVDLTPDQAIEQAIAHYGLKALMPAPAATPAAPAAVPAQAAPQVQPAAPPPPPHALPKVIPRVASGSNSPAAGRPRSKSLADLRKRAAELSKT